MTTEISNSEKKSYTFCLMGASLETNNMGVSALAASTVKIIRIIHADANVVLLIGNKSSKEQLLKLSDNKTLPIKVVNYRLSPKAKLKEHLFWILLMAFLWGIIPIKSIQKLIINNTPWLKSVEQADLIGDIFGGDSFSDIYGIKKLVMISIPVLIVLLMKRNLVLLPQTYGPYKSKIGQIIAKIIINKATYILSRDKQGIIEIQMLTKNQNIKKEVVFCPDVAFMLDPIIPKDVEIEPQINKCLNVPLIGFNVNGLMYNGGYTRDNMFGLKLDYKKFIKQSVLNLLEKTDAHILFIPHTYHPQIESDPDACRDVLNALDGKYLNRVHLVVHEYDQSEIKGIIGLCDFFIGSRMHACIAALSQSIPTIGVAYSKKFKGIFESVGVENMIVDGRIMETEDAVNVVMGFIKDNDKIKDSLHKEIATAKNKIMEEFQKFV
jgi:colanic acid/amylovoran biosynthesis protein